MKTNRFARISAILGVVAIAVSVGSWWGLVWAFFDASEPAATIFLVVLVTLSPALFVSAVAIGARGLVQIRRNGGIEKGRPLALLGVASAELGLILWALATAFLLLGLANYT